MSWLALSAEDRTAIRLQRIRELEADAYRELLLAEELTETESPLAGAPHLGDVVAGHRAQAVTFVARARLLAALPEDFPDTP